MKSKMYRKYTLNSFLALQVQKNKCQELHSKLLSQMVQHISVYLHIIFTVMTNL